MSHDVEAFQRGVDAINRGDVAGASEAVHEDAVFEPQRAATEGAYVGRAGMRRFLADTAEAFDVFRVSHSEIRDLGGGRLLAIGSIRMRGRGSGLEGDVPTAAIVEFRDGLMWRYKDYGDARVALRVAGLQS